MVLQSCPAGERSGWLAPCLMSVEAWAVKAGFGYRWLGDEIFDLLPRDLLPSGRISKVIASDLARLLWARELLLQSAVPQVLWLDADVLIFRPEAMELPQADYAVGREHWVEETSKGRFRVRTKVHNAALLFRADSAGRNSLLDFYIDTATRMLRVHSAGMPPQFIGPKLLTALHNVAQFPVLESVGMVSPALARAMLSSVEHMPPARGESALDCYRRKCHRPLAAANLCRSSVGSGDLSQQDMQDLVKLLEASPAI